MSTSNFIFDAVRPENRVRCVAYNKFFEGIAACAGGVLGAYFIGILPVWIFLSSVGTVFLVSGILRLLVSVVFLPTLKEARLIEMGLGHTFFKKYISIRPSEGIVFEVLGKYHKDDKPVHAHTLFKKFEEKKPQEKSNDEYNKRLVRMITKDISRKKEPHDLTNIHDVEHITEEIEKGKMKK